MTVVTRDEVVWAFELSNVLHLLPVPDNLQALPERIAAPKATVALLGLIKRGKSTLYNRLLGAELSAVAVPPETIATVSATSGEREAAGWTSSGTRLVLPSDPDGFREATCRDSDLAVVAARITGDFRLPIGTTLSDTPGIDEATDLAKVGFRLQERWKASGAGAGIVVLSVPPGLAARDLALIRTATSTFPGAVSVVLKATSSGVSLRDLREVADHSTTIIDRPILCIPDEPGHGPWGTGPLGELEQVITELAGIAAMRHERDVAAFGTFLDALIAEIAKTTAADLATMTAIPDEQLRRMPKRLSSAVSSRVDQLRGEVVRARELRDAKRKQARHAVLNQSAERLIATAHAAISDDDSAATKAAYADILSLAREGSSVAQNELERLLRKHDPDQTAGVELARLLAVLPTGSMQRVCSGLQLPVSRIIHARQSKGLPAEARRPLERRALQLLCATPTDQASDARRSLARQITGLAEDKEVRRGAAALEQSLLFDSLALATRGAVTEEPATWRTTISDVVAARAALADHRKRHPYLQTNDDRERQLLEAFAIQSVQPLRRGLRNRYLVPVADRDVWTRQTSAVEEQVDLICRLSGDARTEVLRKDVDVSRAARDLWLEQSAVHARQAERRYRQITNWWEAMFYFSCALWPVGISLLFLALSGRDADILHHFLRLVGLESNGFVAFLTLVLAFVLWVVWKPGQEGHKCRSWQDYAQVPPSPLSVAPVTPIGWYSDPMSPQGRSRWWNAAGWTHILFDPANGGVMADTSCNWHVPAAWLPDPTGSSVLAWWNGSGWMRMSRSS